jgi:hypothetical protein
MLDGRHRLRAEVWFWPERGDQDGVRWTTRENELILYQILLAENWTESNTLLGTVGPHYFIHYKGWKQT